MSPFGPRRAPRSLFALPAIAAALVACGTAPTDVTVEKGALITGWGKCPAFPSNAMCACTDPSWTGNCAIFSHDTRFFMNLSLFPFTSHNDTITSIVVGPDAKVSIAWDPGNSGVRAMIFGAAPNGEAFYNLNAVALDGAHFNDIISSIRVDNLADDCLNPGTQSVSIFNDANFLLSDPGNCVLLNVGDYPDPYKNPPAGHSPTWAGGGFGMNNDVISSVKLGSNAAIALYPEPNFSGTPLITNASIADLRTTNMNDRTSSIKVGIAGSCVYNGSPICGSQSPVGCWCDTLCSSFGDCCLDKAIVCGP